MEKTVGHGSARGPQLTARTVVAPARLTRSLDLARRHVTAVTQRSLWVQEDPIEY